MIESYAVFLKDVLHICGLENEDWQVLQVINAVGQIVNSEFITHRPKFYLMLLLVTTNCVRKIDRQATNTFNRQIGQKQWVEYIKTKN